MGGLPRPDLPPGPRRDLDDMLHSLHHRAGWPSLRTLAGHAGCSHTTVSKAFSNAALPTWGVLELLVEALHGDVRQVHELWVAASAPAADARRNGTAGQSGMAGRRVELAAVRRHLTSGTGLLVVTGEAGIGKTRLVSTAAASVVGDTFVAVGSCLPLSAEVPLLPVTDVLHTVHAVDGGQWLREALADCAAFVPASVRVLVPELDVNDVAVQPEDEWARQRLFLALSSALASLSSARPLAVLLEDLHWGDSTTLDFLEHLLMTHAAAVPVVGTWRLDDPATERSSAAWLDRVRRLSVVQHVELSPLSRDETAEQLEMLGSVTPDPGWVDHIHGRTQGQPLFTEQLAAEPTSGARTPTLLHDLLDRRLDGLPDPVWSVARALGVADRALSDDQLRDVTGLTGDELSQCLRELRGRRLLAATGSSHDVQLRHPLLAEAVRRRLVAGEATEDHRRLARVLAVSGTPAAEVAVHWRAAEDAVQELTWRIRAARAASSHFAPRQAAQEWLRALELWPESLDQADAGLTRPAAYVAALDELILADDRATGRAVGNEAMTCLPDPDGPEAAELYRRVAVCLGPIDLTAALSMVSRSVGIYEELTPSQGFLVALEVQSHYARASGRYGEAKAAVERAVEISATLDDSSWRRRALVQLAWFDLMAGQPARALARATDAVQITSSAHPDPIAEIVVATEHTDILLVTGARAEEVEDAARPGLAFADWGIGTHLVSVLRSNVARALTDGGHLERSAALLDPVTSAEVTRTEWTDHLERAYLDVARGHVESATARLETLETLMRSYDDSESLRWIAHCAAVADLWRARPRSALDRAVHALSGVDSTSRMFWGSLLLLTARAAADLDQLNIGTRGRAELRQQLADLDARAAIDSFGPGSPCGDRIASGHVWGAERSRLEGTQTVEQWAAAATAWDELSRPYDAGYCRWRAGQVALAQGRGTLATTLLRRAALQARTHVPLSSAIHETATRTRQA